MAIGKLKKHMEMVQNPALRKYIPDTYLYTIRRLKQMLRSYSSVFIKPNYGTGGTGIIKVTNFRNSYEVCFGEKRKYVQSGSLNQLIGSYQVKSQPYLIQRGLQLAQYKGTIFDIRIYMQKPTSKWSMSGMVARIATKNNYVTNYHKGGFGAPLDRVLNSFLKNNQSQVNQKLYTIKNLSYTIATTLNRWHPNIRELGIDFGIEENGRIWIIEANMMPGHQLFKQLPDKTMLHTILKNKNLIKKL